MELVILGAVFGSIGFVGICDFVERKLKQHRKNDGTVTVTVAEKKKTA